MAIKCPDSNSLYLGTETLHAAPLPWLVIRTPLLYVSHCSQVSVQHRHNRSCDTELNESLSTFTCKPYILQAALQRAQQQFLVQAAGDSYKSVRKAFHRIQAHNEAKVLLQRS